MRHKEQREVLVNGRWVSCVFIGRMPDGRLRFYDPAESQIHDVSKDEVGGE